jgi:hypothetical protein
MDEELKKYLFPVLANIIMEYAEQYCCYCQKKIWKDKFLSCRYGFKSCPVICGKCNYQEKYDMGYEKRRDSIGGDWNSWCCRNCRGLSSKSIALKRLAEK